MTRDQSSSPDRPASHISENSDSELSLQEELAVAQKEARAAKWKLQELEIQIHALKNASDIIQKDLVSKNNELSERLERQEAEIAQIDGFSKISAAPVDAHFHERYTEIESKVYRRMMASLCQRSCPPLYFSSISQVGGIGR